MDRFFVENVGEGLLNLKALVIKTDEGVNIYLGGGEKPHIGSVVISQPRRSLKGNGTISCTTSVFNLLGHKDDHLAIPLCEYLCTNLNQVVVVTAGVHIDNATPEDIETFKTLLKHIKEAILDKLIKMNS